MKYLSTALFLYIPATAAKAHIGHLGEVAGHGHWVAGAALGAAGLITLIGALKGKKKSDENADAEDIEPDQEEA